MHIENYYKNNYFRYIKYLEGQIIKTSELLEEKLKEYKFKEDKYHKNKNAYTSSKQGVSKNFIIEKTAEFIYSNKMKEENQEENKDENNED